MGVKRHAPEDPVSILIAEDEEVSRRRLERALAAWGHKTLSCVDGASAWHAYTHGDFDILLTDWVMPGLTGLDLCKKVREHEEGSRNYTYVILLTGRDEGLVEGMSAGADDYIAKPFAPGELRVRIQAGMRLLNLERSLSRRVGELQIALDRVRRLEGLLPICSYCKNIRDEDANWQSVEGYVTKRSEARFSHSICPTCYEKEVIPLLEESQD